MLKLTTGDSLIVMLCVGASNLFWLPVSGSFSDRVGRKPLLIACTLLMIITAYPAMLWLVDGPTFWKLLLVELWLSFLYGCYNGAMVVFLTEIMPVEVRTAGFSLAYSLATAIFGGFTPAISTYLIQTTGNREVPGLWLAFAGRGRVWPHRRPPGRSRTRREHAPACGCVRRGPTRTRWCPGGHAGPDRAAQLR